MAKVTPHRRARSRAQGRFQVQCRISEYSSWVRYDSYKWLWCAKFTARRLETFEGFYDCRVVDVEMD